MQTNKLDEMFSASKSPKDYAQKYCEYLGELLKTIDYKAVEEVINLFLKARENKKKIIFIGNGGSAATSSHFANDIGIGPRDWERPFRAMSLTDNNAVLTCLANDEGYDHVFEKQLRLVMEDGDLLVAISASGNSQNLLNAVNYANSKGNHTIGLTGFDGGKLMKISKTVLHINTRKGEYGPVEDLHMIFDHLIGTYLMRAIRN